MSRRRHIPLSVKLEVALRQLGLDPNAVQLDHHPALGFRERTADGGYIPDELDPLAMVWRSTVAHRTKTTGTPPGQKVVHVANGDQHKIAKAKRHEKDRLERLRQLAEEDGRAAIEFYARDPMAPVMTASITIAGYKPDDPLPASVLSVLDDAERATRGARKSSWPKGRKMQSRPFQKKAKPGG